ncbi:hypothetical protein [Tautonia rosea]|uniref:hypothetical protein n=1 Tax=Tautonia rosea TaxID=2728037 RepID=UPI001475A806|nr:hypothetical protein [Tautonia rosea]
MSLLLVGCEPSPSNRSPSAQDNPERAARARAQMEAVEQANREAEAAFYRSLRVETVPEFEEAVPEQETAAEAPG